jgi:hypothetical protein
VKACRPVQPWLLRTGVPHIDAMILLAVTYASMGRQETVEITLDPAYGSDAWLVHAVMHAVLTAEWPIVINSSGEPVRLPTGSVRAWSTRAVE